MNPKKYFSAPMKVGASYYPEVGTQQDWERDLDTARDLGMNVLRCGEFAWDALFTPEGKPTMDWVRRFLDIAVARGHDVVWCTPSATPPPYIFDRWPDLHATNCSGVIMPVGIRRHYCPSHPGYLDLCAEVAAHLIKELGGHPAIRGWQVDNELAGDGFTCWCDRCGATFNRWLEQRYGSLDKLNEAWQTSVWSQSYTRWGQVPVPHRHTGNHTPALKLAWRRFRSDNWLNFYNRQADALRAGGAKAVTTNFYNLSWDMPFDRWKWRNHMDAMGLSHYVEDSVDSGFELAGLLGPNPGEKPLWILEQKAGQQVSQNLIPEDLGRIERHLTACADAGAECSVYWHLKQHSAGPEMEHGAVLRHDGKPTRIARAVQAGTKVAQAVAAKYASGEKLLVFSYHQAWANETRPVMGSAYDHRIEMQQSWFAATGGIRVGQFTDVKPGIQVILAPFFQINEPGAEDIFRKAVEAGATLVTTVDFLRLDNENNVRRIAPLAATASWIHVPDIELYQLKADAQVEGNLDGKPAAGHYFWGVPESTNEGIHRIGEGKLGDVTGPLALEFSYGKGKLIVALTALDKSGVQVLLAKLNA